MADNHESAHIAVGFGVLSQYVTRVISHAALFNGHPTLSGANRQRALVHQSYIDGSSAAPSDPPPPLIEPGRPMQNGYIESSNGKLRNEHLNECWF
jgi:putative transposase